MITAVKTEDGSTTFFNEEYNQCYHSKVGAYTEALEKHVIPCEILELAQKIKTEGNTRTLNLLDVCFGLGYNSGVAIEKALEVNPEIKINIIALENDIEILKRIAEIAIPESYTRVHQSLVKALKEELNNYLNAKTNNRTLQRNLDLKLDIGDIKIKILLGDARKTIKEFRSELNSDLIQETRSLNLDSKIFDAVFFDPFSPAECPELWTLEFIKDLIATTKPGAIISTYSSARIVKENFKAAGCSINEGPKVGRRSGGVLARVL